MPRARLDWLLSSEDYASTARSAAHLASVLAARGIGRLQLRMDGQGHWPLAGGGFHPLGTTRMSHTPQKGVVDLNLRVHGMHDLYVAGSSVFPTGSYANPTLPAVTVAMRLADHLDRELRHV